MLRRVPGISEVSLLTLLVEVLLDKIAGTNAVAGAPLFSLADVATDYATKINPATESQPDFASATARCEALLRRYATRQAG